MVKSSGPSALFTARFSGPRWVVVMTNPIWDRFSRLPLAAKARLTAALKDIGEYGVADAPGRAFRWVGRSVAGPQLAELEAYGVVLSGHVSPIENRQQFFVTQIIVDELEDADAPLRVRARNATDDRQGKFKFEQPTSKKPSTEGEPE